MIAAAVICTALILATTGGLLCVWGAERPARGKHSRRADVPEAAPLPAAGQLPMLPDEPRPLAWPQDDPGQWWGVPPPQPSVIEVITGPGTRIAQTSELVLNVLGRVRDRLRELSPPPAATVTAADPDATRTDMPVVPSAGPDLDRAELIARYLP